MRFVDRLIAAFVPAKHIIVDSEASRAAIDRDVIMQRSHGNLRLQYGQYYTNDDIKKQVKAVKAINFADSA